MNKELYNYDTLIHSTENKLPTQIDPKNNICVVVTHQDGSKEWWYGSNLVTDWGDIYYAKKAAGETPSTGENFFAPSCVLNNPASADTIAKDDKYGEVNSPITTGTGTATDSVRPLTVSSPTYPKTNDQDSDNTGASADSVSYRFDWATTQMDTGSGTQNPIRGGAIYDATRTGSNLTATTLILTHWNFANPASFHKTSTDTLKLFVNHTFNGVTTP